jgi:uncharacterized OsmC-like protein
VISGLAAVLPERRCDLADRPGQGCRPLRPLAAPCGATTIGVHQANVEGVAMTAHDIAIAMQRAKRVLQRHPEMSSHANGIRLSTDMPGELGGSGDQITPGWLFRAGLASCFATCIAMGAADEGIELTTLEVLATSRSDSRGLLGVRDANGEAVFAGPSEVRLHVRIGAHNATAERLKALVKSSQPCSPIPNAVQCATPVAFHIDIDVG